MLYANKGRRFRVCCCFEWPHDTIYIRANSTGILARPWPRHRTEIRWIFKFYAWIDHVTLGKSAVRRSNFKVISCERSFFLYRWFCVSSQMSAFSSARCRDGRPLGNLVTGQSSTICIIVCCGAPQSQQVGYVICCQRVRLAAHRPWPVLKRFSVHGIVSKTSSRHKCAVSRLQ